MLAAFTPSNPGAGTPTPAPVSPLLSPSGPLSSLTPASPALPSATPAPQLRDIVGPQPYFVPINYLYVAAALAVLALLAWIGWRLLKPHLRPRPPVDNRTPRQIAAARLEELRRRAPQMEARLFGAEVCDVLRAFIGARHGLHPERQTSPEFLASIAGSVRFSPDEHILLADFLTQCDLLKFARLDAELPAKERLIEQAVKFIEGSDPALSLANVETPPPLPVGVSSRNTPPRMIA